MTETEKAIKGLRSYSSTSWENGGPGESTLVSEIRVVLAEIERLQGILAWHWREDCCRCKHCREAGHKENPPEQLAAKAKEA